MRDGDEAIRWWDLRLGRLATRTGGRTCWERNESTLEGPVEKSVVGDDRDSTESSAGLAMALTLILSGGGVGGGVMMQSTEVCWKNRWIGRGGFGWRGLEKMTMRIFAFLPGFLPPNLSPLKAFKIRASYFCELFLEINT